jgi:hypothetical protein
MSDSVFNDVCNAVRRGARLSVGRNYFGGIRLKIAIGPFGLFQRRFHITAADLQRLQNELRLRPVNG